MAEENEKTQANALEPKMKLKGTISQVTIGGAIVDLGPDQLPGVIHISQFQKDHLTSVEDAVKVGDEIEAWVRRVKKDRVELTMIEPLPLEWRELKPNMVVKGKVERLESYGAFVEIGAERPGLVHISEIAHGYIKDPSQVVKVGDEVDVMVLEVNRRKKQIRLSMKEVLPEPEESAKPQRRRGKKRKQSVEDMMAELEDSEPKTPEHTVMEMAWQAALERADASNNKTKSKKKKKEDQAQEEILSRTLKGQRS